MSIILISKIQILIRRQKKLFKEAIDILSDI